jgi:hypothetical protein
MSDPQVPINPYTGEAVIALADAVPRQFRWNFYAMALMQEFLRDHAGPGAPGGLMLMRATLWAGLYRDAARRGEPWTPDHLDELLPTEPDKLAAIGRQIARARNCGLNGPAEGETPAASAGGSAAAEAKRSRGTGKKR